MSSKSAIAASAGIGDNYRGAAFMTAAMASFAVNDLITKAFTGEFSMGQFLLLRGIVAIAIVTAAAAWTGQLRAWRTTFQPLMAARAVGEMIATWCFLKALFHIPLASLSAVMQALPLALTLFAALILGEKIGWRRIAAILVGFLGVLIIVRPGMEGFNVYSFYSLAAVGGCVIRDLATRKLSAEIPSLFVTLVATCAVTAMGGILSAGEDWQPVQGWHVVLMCASSIFLLTGYFFAIAAMRVGEMGFVQPFRYSVLLFVMIGAAIVYAEYPDTWTLVGAAIIVTTGIYTLYRERIVKRQAIVPAPVRG